jgi:enamine deaminase RidA (YjgF/YER057c/UK114 family)
MKARMTRPDNIEEIQPEDVYEPFFDKYSQVVKSEGTKQIDVSGTTGISLETNDWPESAQKQIQLIIQHIENCVRAAGGEPSDIVRVRHYAIDISDYMANCYPFVEAWYEEHGFRPASTALEVSGLVNDGMKCEMEAVAILE